MRSRKIITRDMITAAKEMGWNITQTSNHYEMHRTSISKACERFGIELAQSKFDPQIPSTRSKFWKETVEKPKPKTQAIWSCSPAAIKRALAKRGVKYETHLRNAEQQAGGG
jgi:hypothetical protein